MRGSGKKNMLKSVLKADVTLMRARLGAPWLLVNPSEILWPKFPRELGSSWRRLGLRALPAALAGREPAIRLPLQVGLCWLRGLRRGTVQE